MSLNLTHVFPIPILDTKIDDGITDDVISLVNAFVEDKKLLANSLPGDLVTTFYDDKDLLGTLKAYDLLNEITINSRTFMELLGYDKDGHIEISSWLQYNKPQSHFFRHDHYGALVSGVVYLQTPEKCGDIVFHTPLELRRAHGTFYSRLKVQENNYNYDDIRITPQKGLMLLFDSWLQHTVERNYSTDNRISISFNIMAGKIVD